MKILKKLSVLLDKKQKMKMLGLILLMIVGAVLETSSITLVVPVMTVVLDAKKIQTNAILNTVYTSLGMKSIEQFTIVVMVALIITFILKNLFLFFQQKMLYRFVYHNQFSTSERLMKNYMRRGYEYFLNADTATIQRNITADVNNMYALIMALLQIVSEMIISLSLVAVLFAMEPVMTIIIGVLLFVTLLVIKVILKPIMKRTGQDNQDFNAALFKWISQTVSGIKEIKIMSKEKYFVDEYVKCGHGYVNAVQKFTLYSNTPKLIIETVCIAGMVSYMLILVLAGSDVSAILPIIGAFAVAAMRLMPSANRINNQLTYMAFYEPFFMGVSDNLQDEINGENTDISFACGEVEKMPITKSIELKNIVYAYPNTEKLIFDNADMEIPIGASVGVVGSSGSGKTTVVDILLGLLENGTGDVYADGVNIKTNYRGWLKNVGYIPQMIFMLDDTIRKNVAFGVAEEDIDENKLWYALKEAQLDEFVKTLPDGLETQIGERGIRISGGQRQRIGIARALYDDPEVLILDEATSALDNDTEAAIMESINYFQGRKTLIIIAHRLQTIEKCNMVYRVENGKIIKER